jgi:predicted transcriptional regulator of viral defense system
MKKNTENKYKIKIEIIKNYVDAINSMSEPMCQIKAKINMGKPLTNQLNSIKEMSLSIKKLCDKYSNEKEKIYTSIIKQIMEINNGIISSRMIDSLNISRQYISKLKNKKEIEKVSRGVYLSSNTFLDSYYAFQIKYKKTIFSHMNALYFYGMTEEFPYRYTVTVPQNYHDSSVNKKSNVFYVSDDILEIGLCEVETQNGNKIRAYDLERCICDIIKSKNRMDIEQVKKTIKQYIKSKNKNINKLIEYSEKMGISNQVIEMVGMYNE